MTPRIIRKIRGFLFRPSKTERINELLYELAVLGNEVSVLIADGIRLNKRLSEYETKQKYIEGQLLANNKAIAQMQLFLGKAPGHDATGKRNKAKTKA